MTPEEIAELTQASKNEARLIAHHVAEIMKAFGPPPISIGEDPRDFERLLVKIIRARCADDAFLQLDVWDITVSIWLDKRYNRASTWVLDRQIRENLEFQKQRAEQKTIDVGRSDEAAEHRQKADRSAGEKRKAELQSVIKQTPQEVEILLDQAAAEEANARAFEQALPVLTAIDDLKTRNFFRRNVSIQTWRERRPGYLPPLSHAEFLLKTKREEEDRVAWTAEFLEQQRADQAAKLASAANPPKDLPTVPSPGLGKS
jgi:hypothetical protein